MSGPAFSTPCVEADKPCPYSGAWFTPRWEWAVGTLAIFLLALIVYRPILPGSFVMDDQRVAIEHNGLVNGEFSPLTIWFRTDFPLSSLTFWLEWLAWGMRPGWYHGVNVLLHACSAVLVWRLLARLGIKGAWLAGALFAVHPVCVGSVARISELKNTLSLPFFLLSAWTYFKWEERSASANKSREHGGAWSCLWYAGSLIAFVLALLSKTTTVMLPPVLLATVVWRQQRVTMRDALHTCPHFLLALGFGLMSCWFQKHQALAGETLAPESFWQRLAAAGDIFWFYLGKACWPARLNLFYPSWTINARAAITWLPVFLALALFAVAWSCRKSWGRHVLFGLGCFALMLFPALGFFDAQFLTTWRVSDHLQYLAIIAPLALLAAALVSLPALILFPQLPRVLAGLALATVTALGLERAKVFANEEVLFRDTLAKNPAAGPVHNDFGVVLARQGHYAAAASEFATAVSCDPKNAAARANLGQALALQGHAAEAEAQFVQALKIKASDAESQKKYADFLERGGRRREAVLHWTAAMVLKPEVETGIRLAALLYQDGQWAAAADQLRKVVKMKPANALALNNLAWLLATCADGKVRNGGEAVQDAEAACRLTANKQPGYVSTLAAAYAEAGRFEDAVRAAETAVRMQTAAGQTTAAALNQQLLKFYRAGKPYHEQARTAGR